MKKTSSQWPAWVLPVGMIVVVIVAFAWMARSVLLGASPIFVLGAVYTTLLFRQVPQTSRASMVMLLALPLTFYSWLSVEDSLGIPAAASWGLGFIAGALGSGRPWSGKRPRTADPQEAKSNAKEVEAVGSRRLLPTVAGCVAVLIGGGLAHLAFQSPTAAVAAVLAGALLCGWALFRFPPSPLTRNMLLLVVPVEFFLLAFLGGNTSQPALPFAWAYGALAGVLLGGHYWSGPLRGTPRPPFSADIKRRRQRKKVRRSQDRPKSKVVPTGRR
ncbi:hypothetical protein J2790_003800 [Paenarthrobacter nicotinovorans]|uniref:hypothetical protein n=1 Tax=Micrococcaceae TaxID=1268 RepID=UPI000876451C|nr:MULTISPECIES: hypothetical protein [Micrococcaceae]MDR6438635.1 hypothetical protein [Paenarthrobacter nicotinovorans]SCZ59616.1 hypothetical protein SAMN02799638_02802 [Arthrobacter sp. UNCCL28]